MVFLQKREDKVAYLKGMVLLAKADGRIEKSEVEYINAAVVGMGLDESEKKEIDVMWNDEGECLIEFSPCRRCAPRGPDSCAARC